MVRFVTFSHLYRFLRTCAGPVSVIVNGHRWTYNDPANLEEAIHLGPCTIL